MNLLLQLLFLLNLWKVVTKNDAYRVPKMFQKYRSATKAASYYYRVIKGKPANEQNKLPYQVAIVEHLRDEQYRMTCGGVLIAPNKVLSAAHCFYTDNKKSPCGYSLWGPSYIKPLDKMKVAAGTVNKKPEEEKFGNETDYNETTTEIQLYNRTAFPRSSRGVLDFTEIQEINETFVPRNFNFPRRDITVVFTAGPFDKRIPVPYAQDFKTYEGLTCTASGYAGPDYIGWERVHWVKLKIISTAECSKLHNTNMRRFVCTLGYPEDLEEGDAGGPLVCKKTGHAGEGPLGILVGIICGKRIFREGTGKNETIKSSVFYTRVSTYKGFIANPSRDNKAIIMIVPDFTIWISAFIFSARVFNYF